MMNLRKVNPSVKLLCLIALSCVFMLTGSVVLNMLLTVIFMLWLVACGVSFKKLVKILIPVSIAAVGLFITASLFGNHHVKIIGSSHDVTSYEQALSISTRVFVFASLGMLFSLTTENFDLMTSLRDQMKLPNVFVYGIFATLNLLPNIQNQFKKNRVAFEARGIKVHKISIKSLMPLLIKTVYWTDAVTLAMASKRFNPKMMRTIHQRQRLSKHDLVFGVVIGCLITLILVF